jgi:predicted permease
MKRLFRFPFRSRDDIQADIREEFDFHLHKRAEELERLGLDPSAARRRAEQEFGNQARGLEGCRRVDERLEWTRMAAGWLDECGRDARYGLRVLLRAPALSATIVLTLTLGIAANATVFSLINALLLRPPAFDRPERLVRVQLGESRMSWPNFEDLRRAARFGELAAQEHVVAALESGGPPVRATGALVTVNYFTLLGTPAALGRPLLPADAQQDAVVLSDRFWRSHFAADPAVLGRTVRINGRLMEVVGVMPRDFRGIAPPGLGRQFWMPFGAATGPASQDRRTPSIEVFARLSEDADREAARAELGVFSTRLRGEHPELPERILSVQLSGMAGFDAFRGIGGFAVPLFGFVGLLALLGLIVLLVSCANVAGLLLGRSAVRSREMAIRLALGSGRARLVRQLLIESAWLALLAGALGLVLSSWIAAAVPAALAYLPFPVDLHLSIDVNTLLYTAAIVSFAALVFGLAPARHAARTELVSVLKNESGAGGRRIRTRLVTGQVFACTVLLVWASLFARSLQNVSSADPGFTTADVFVVDADTQASSSPAAEHDRYRRLFDRVRGLPDVEGAGFAWAVPLAFSAREEHGVQLVDVADGPERRVMANTISPGFLDTLRIPLKAGRDLSWSDAAGSVPVVLVNETAARQFWGGPAVGRRLRIPERNGTVEAEVVGVVADTKYWTLGEEIAPAIYRPMLQRAMGMHLFVRTSAPAATLPALRAAFEDGTPGMPVEIRRFSDATAASLMPARVGSFATGGFGLTALVLAVMGVYGLVSFTVVQRHRELAIRRAVGASTGRILGLVVHGSVTGVLKGLAAGVVIGAAGAFALANFLVGVSPIDPVVNVLVVLVMLVTVAGASIVPAIRATRVEPLGALRDQ